MEKKDAIRVLSECAKLYKAHLLNKNILIIFDTKNGLEYFEAVFLPRHFLHLTGVGLTYNVGKSSDFFRRCLSGRLSLADFYLLSDGTTEMKLRVLPQIMQIQRFAKMIGDYDGSKTWLYTEKIAGNVTACIGFVLNDDGKYYSPNTALNEDIRKITNRPQHRILGIYMKNVRDSKYTKKCFVAKGVNEMDFYSVKELASLLPTVDK
ncbi:MAG: hypothetical protein IJV40_05320 [Oscillospiraceae bacterium]|nr:hypothetical protein [Oscillospiraceae bacterium]